MGALLSSCGTYRYVLTRKIEQPEHRTPSTVCWVMLNPSTADADTDDPTIRRCMGFSKRLGFTSMRVVNLLAYRATDPRELWKAKIPIGETILNQEAVRDQVALSSVVIAAWGAAPQAVPHARRLWNAVLRQRIIDCLGTTKSGAPKHPLYLAKNTPCVAWNQWRVPPEYLGEGALPGTGK